MLAQKAQVHHILFCAAPLAFPLPRQMIHMDLLNTISWEHAWPSKMLWLFNLAKLKCLFMCAAIVLITPSHFWACCYNCIPCPCLCKKENVVKQPYLLARLQIPEGFYITAMLSKPYSMVFGW